MQERDSNLSFATAAEMDEGEAVFPKGERLKTEAGKHKGGSGGRVAICLTFKTPYYD